MSDAPQRTVKCKLCPAEITWHKDPVSGKNYPKNLDGSPHRCIKKDAPAPEKTPDQIAKDREEYNKKAQAAGFNTGTCTSPETPAVTPANIKTVDGQIVFLDKPAHKITLKARDGQQHTFIWGPALDAEFSKLNQWWFCKVTGEHEADVDLWRATAQGFFKRPDDWPFAKGGNAGGRPFQPRNEKPIIMQVIFKEACETARQQMRMSEKFDAAEADAAWEWAVAKTEATMDRLCKVGGV